METARPSALARGHATPTPGTGAWSGTQPCAANIETERGDRGSRGSTTTSCTRYSIYSTNYCLVLVESTDPVSLSG